MCNRGGTIGQKGENGFLINGMGTVVIHIEIKTEIAKQSRIHLWSGFLKNQTLKQGFVCK